MQRSLKLKAGVCAAPLLFMLTGCGNKPAAPVSAAAPNAAAAAPESLESEAVEIARPVTLPAGTTLRVRLAQSLDTSRNRAGEHFEATLASAISREGTVALPQHTRFRGHVTSSKPSGRLRSRGYLGLTLDSFELDGKTYNIRTSSKTFATGSHKKRNFALIGGGSGLGALIGGLAGGGKGALIGAGAGAAAGTTGAALTGKKNVHLAPEAVVTFTLRSPVEVTPAHAGTS